MPNGGTDNCGTCWFNARNKGEAGYDHINDEGIHYCVIRNQVITGDAFHTYCANSPYNTNDKIPTPIGPIYVASQEEGSPARVQWQPSPDSEEIRLKLLELLTNIEETPQMFMGNLPWDDLVIWQLGEFRERRALDGLSRIMAFDPAATAPERGAWRTRQLTVALAEDALAKIET